MNKDEQILRENIKQLIKHVKQKRASEEQEVRNSLKKLMRLELKKMIMESDVPDVDPSPNKSTGINVLEQLLKKIVPVLQIDYKSLTTAEDQRQSFRAHIINAVINTLTPAKINNAAASTGPDALDEEIDIEIGDDDKFIDIRTDAEKKTEEEDEAPDEREEFGSGVDGDETGRNMAYESFKKIESSIIDSYELLSNPEDQELYFDYLIANLKLYFDKFESELAGQVEEPTNQAYDTAKEETAPEEGGGADLGLGGEEEELEIEL